MTQLTLTIGISAVLAMATTACGGSTEQQFPAGAVSNTTKPAGEAAIHADTHGTLAVATITLKSDPDPPKRGENRFEVTVMDHEKQPVSDAEVSAEFFMPAMPSMNMPEIRQSIPLTQAASGTYAGFANLAMAGAWDVGVSVKRAGTEIAGTKFKITAQ